MNVHEMTMKELVEYYNAHSDKPVKRFSDRKAAERRVIELVPTNKLSTAIRESWKDPETAAKRAQRSAVKVNGEWFKSVGAAFRAFDLPMNEQIKFRMNLKKIETTTAYGMRWEIQPLNY